MKKLNQAVLPALALCTLVAACGDDEPTGPDVIDVSIAFSAQVGGAAFVCGTSYDDVGTMNTTITPTDYRFYVHDVRLITASGSEVSIALDQTGDWQMGDLTLLDFEDGTGSCVNGTAATNTVVEGTVPAASYSGIAFRLGVPEDMNHMDQTAAPAPLDLSGLFWNWNAGYKFLRIDHTSAAMPGGWNVHLGSTGCSPTGSPTTPAIGCVNEHRPEMVFSSFDHENDEIVADLARLLEGSDLTFNTASTASGCMSFPGDADCPPVMNRLGLDYEGVNSSGQTFFSVN